MAVALLAVAAAVLSGDYPDCVKYSVSTADDYVVCWDRAAASDPKATRLELELQVKTLGWIGFGIPEQSVGGMVGADVLALEQVGGEAVGRDYYTVGETFPTLDACAQDWEVLRSSQSGGVTTVVVSRAFEAEASIEDRSIPRGPMKVILAYGSSPTLGYHGAVRRADGISFIGDVDPPLPADAYSVKLMMKNYTLERKRTMYTCQAFDMTDYTNIDTTKWAVRFEMLDTVKPRGAKHIVHHAGLYSCRYNSAQWKKYQTPGQCGTDAGVECGEVVFAWALGMGPLSMPLEAGFKVNHWVNRFMIMEIHYDNPHLVEEVDDSGVLMTLSPTAREHEAGVMHLGDPFVGLDGRVIPAGAPYSVQAECRAECTKTMPTPVTIFASHLHMHNVGKRIRITQLRGGEVINTIDSIDYWDFDFQGTNRVDHIQLLPGDALHTTCEWENTLSRDVRFGLATEEEMCMGYLYTYPAHISYCGWYNQSKYATACGRNDTAVAYVVTKEEVPDPTVRTDPAVPVVFGKPGKCPATPVPTAAPTLAPPTESPQTPAPPTSVPATPAPVTPAPQTSVPPTPAPKTPVPDTPAPDTAVPVTPAPATPVPRTAAPASPAPPTGAPVTPEPATGVPLTPVPATVAPKTPAPKTEAPLTPVPATPVPRTAAPATPAPPTGVPVTRVPDTEAPSTPAPASLSPATPASGTATPQTPAPPTPVPRTAAPATPVPHASAPRTAAPSVPMTPVPATSAPATTAPLTSAPMTPVPPTVPANTPAPMTEAPATAAPGKPVTPAPATSAPATAVPLTSAPMTPVPPPAPKTEAPATSASATTTPGAPVTPAPPTTTTGMPATPAPATAPLTPVPPPVPASTPAPKTQGPATAAPGKPVTHAPATSAPATGTSAPATPKTPTPDTPVTPAPGAPGRTSTPAGTPPSPDTAPPATTPAASSTLAPGNSSTPASINSTTTMPGNTTATPAGTPRPVPRGGDATPLPLGGATGADREKVRSLSWLWVLVAVLGGVGCAAAVVAAVHRHRANADRLLLSELMEHTSEEWDGAAAEMQPPATVRV